MTGFFIVFCNRYVTSGRNMTDFFGGGRWKVPSNIVLVENNDCIIEFLFVWNINDTLQSAAERLHGPQTCSRES